MARYRATRDGYIGHYIRAGEFFDFGGPAPSWAVAVVTEPAPADDDPLEEAPPAKSHKKKVK